MRIAVLCLTLGLFAQSPDVTIPATGRVLAQVEGQGVQIYQCTGQGTTFQWTFQAPEAVLSDPTSHARLGSHGAGPSWIWTDGSTIHGKVLQKVASPDTASIPWLLLEAQQDPTHPGFLRAAAYIRRSQTRGGNAPSTGCDATHASATARVPYSATYTFYTAN